MAISSSPVKDAGLSSQEPEFKSRYRYQSFARLDGTADTSALEADARDGVGVQIPHRAPI